MRERSAAFARGRRFLAFLAALSMILVLLTSTFAMAESVSPAEGSGLTVKISGSMEGGNLGAAGSIIESGSINFRYGTDADGALINAAVSLGDTDFLSLLLKATQEKIALQIPQAGEDVYEMSTQKAAEYVTELISGLQDAAGTAIDPEALIPHISEELITEALSPVMEALSEHIAANTAVSAGAFSLEKLGRTYENGTVYTYKPTAEEIEKFLNNLADIAESNEALGELITGVADYVRGLEGIATFTNTAAGSPEEFDAQQTADAIEQFYAELPQTLHEGAGEIGQTLEAMDATVNVGITEEGVPALIELRLTQDGQTLRAALELAVTDHDVTYYLVLQIDEEEYAVFGNTESDDNALKGHHTIYQSSMGSILDVNYNLHLTKRSLLGLFYGEIFVETVTGLKLDVLIGEGESAGSDRHSITISEIAAQAGEEAGVPDIVTVHVDSIPENTAVAPTGNPVDISDYTPEQYTELFDRIVENITAYLNQ